MQPLQLPRQYKFLNDNLVLHRAIFSGHIGRQKLNFLTGNWPSVICHRYILLKRCQAIRTREMGRAKSHLGSFIKVFTYLIITKKENNNILLTGPMGKATQYSGSDNESKTSQAIFSLLLWCQGRCFENPHCFSPHYAFFRS